MKNQKVILNGESLKIEDVLASCRKNVEVITPPEIIKKVQNNWNAVAQC